MSMTISKWLLSASLTRKGDLYPHFTLIDHAKMESSRYQFDKHCLPNEIKERIAMMRIRRGDFTNTLLGAWIGDRHFVVALNKDEFYKLTEQFNGDSRK